MLGGAALRGVGEQLHQISAPRQLGQGPGERDPRLAGERRRVIDRQIDQSRWGIGSGHLRAARAAHEGAPPDLARDQPAARGLCVGARHGPDRDPQAIRQLAMRRQASPRSQSSRRRIVRQGFGDGHVTRSRSPRDLRYPHCHGDNVMLDGRLCQYYFDTAEGQMTEMIRDIALEREALRRAAALGESFLAGVAQRPVGPLATADELRAALGGPLPESGIDPVEVIEDLARGVERGLMGSAGPRFFGFVIGGGYPAAVAADWLTSVWDQNAGLFATSPAAS